MRRQGLLHFSHLDGVNIMEWGSDKDIFKVIRLSFCVRVHTRDITLEFSVMYVRNLKDNRF